MDKTRAERLLLGNCVLGAETALEYRKSRENLINTLRKVVKDGNSFKLVYLTEQGEFTSDFTAAADTWVAQAKRQIGVIGSG